MTLTLSPSNIRCLHKITDSDMYKTNLSLIYYEKLSVQYGLDIHCIIFQSIWLCIFKVRGV